MKIVRDLNNCMVTVDLTNDEMWGIYFLKRAECDQREMEKYIAGMRPSEFYEKYGMQPQDVTKRIDSLAILFRTYIDCYEMPLSKAKDQALAIWCEDHKEV